ncbi:peptidoglycan-binding domain-containing protein [Oceanibaculum sp.]|uniref:peptidoglycan-binding domain-containing protein n=1 Tax=Oceanibaculum sp. TaxID=1903597 RepID=UPI00258556E3|nr:peptidoglycan-binding domain-containing protein [Oceanibaculum sp.]MCH2393855.1 peptidoglycan-binding protein [Oceanibaculum sp.]
MRAKSLVTAAKTEPGRVALLALAAIAFWALAKPAAGMTLPPVPDHAPVPTPLVMAQAVESMPEQMRTATIRAIQETLNEKGFKAGPVDGAMGPRTRSALRDYQRKAGLPVDGVASKDVLDHMKFARPEVSAGTGSAAPKQVAGDPLTRDVQRELLRLGYYGGAIDGLYGPATRQAIERYQYDHGKSVTGNVGQDLLEELRGMKPGQVGTTGLRT